MSIKIVTHVYARKLPQFAVFLRAQLSSLVLHPPKVPVVVDIHCCLEDDNLADVLFDFKGLNIKVCLQPPNDLFRRSIGRNISALKSTEDIVWFTDVDYIFGEGCLDRLNEIWSLHSSGRYGDMVWPDTVLIHKDHETGDKFWQSNLETRGVLDINPDDFIPMKYRSAFGGVQIVDGDFARRFGYLNHYKKWQAPRTDNKPFGDFRDDVKYRKFCEEKGCVFSISLPNLYRLRHTKVT